MDGQVAAIRAALDGEGFGQTAIMAYASKHASAFYGPFREAADSAPAFGDRRGYQMDPANGREALREMALDVAEGADILLVKPALPGLDLDRCGTSAVRPADRRLPGVRRVRDDRRRRRAGLARRAARDDRGGDRDRPGRRRDRHHIRRRGHRDLAPGGAMSPTTRSTSRRSRSGSIRPGGAGPTRSATTTAAASARRTPRPSWTACGASATRRSASSPGSISCSGGWRPAVDALEAAAAALLRAGLGRWLTVTPLAHRPDRAVAVRQKADRPGAVALQRRPLALPRRLPVHEEHRLVPPLEGGAPGRDERAHAGRPRVPDDPPGAGLLVRARLAGLRRRLRDRRPGRVRRPRPGAARDREPAIDGERHADPARDPPSDRRDPRPAWRRRDGRDTTIGSRTAALVERAERLFPGWRQQPRPGLPGGRPAAARPRARRRAVRLGCRWAALRRLHRRLGPGDPRSRASGGRRGGRGRRARMGSRSARPIHSRSSSARRSERRCHRWSASGSPRRAPRR